SLPSRVHVGAVSQQGAFMRVRYLDWLVVLTVLSTGCADPWALTPNSPPADAVAAIGATATPIQVFGSWHCGNDAWTWASVRAMTDFVTMKHWLVDRGDGRPSVNVVVLSFVHPYRLL